MKGIWLGFVWLALSRTLAAQAAPQQAVVETSTGTFVIDLAPDRAPNQTAYFLKQVAAGVYDGTIFHRVVKNGMVQGGDPLTKDAGKRALYDNLDRNAELAIAVDQAVRTSRQDDWRNNPFKIKKVKNEIRAALMSHWSPGGGADAPWPLVVMQRPIDLSVGSSEWLEQQLERVLALVKNQDEY